MLLDMSLSKLWEIGKDRKAGMLWSMGLQKKSDISERLNKNVIFLGYPGGSVTKYPLAKQETWVRFLVQEDPLEEVMATHSSILAWEIPWTEEPARL